MKNSKIGVFVLTALIFSSMVGGGIFSIPQNMAMNSSLGAGIVAWLITGFGIFCIANTFITLSIIKPNLNTGIYSYAEDGFGKFIGFATGWSYLICNNLVVISLAIMSMSTLDYFFPGYFTGGNNLSSIIFLSLIIWSFNFIMLRGFKFSATFNVVATILKFSALAIFIIVMLFVFNWNNFTYDFLGQNNVQNSLPISKQITSSLLITLWSFIGIETGNTLSDKAENKKVVKISTLISFFMCLVLYIMLSSLPYGFLTQAEIAKIPDPSAAGILEIVLGKSGAFIINLGVLIAILSCWFSWILVLIEVPSIMAEDNNFPKMFAKKNKNNVAYVSAFTTSTFAQIGILLAFFSNNAWIMMQSLSGVMIIPAYLLSSLYLLKIINLEKHFDDNKIKKYQIIFFAIISCLFIFLIAYSCDIGYIMADFILFALAVPMFIWTNKKQRIKNIFTKNEKIIAVFLVLLSIIAILCFVFGFIKIPNLV